MFWQRRGMLEEGMAKDVEGQGAKSLCQLGIEVTAAMGSTAVKWALT